MKIRFKKIIKFENKIKDYPKIKTHARFDTSPCPWLRRIIMPYLKHTNRDGFRVLAVNTTKFNNSILNTYYL